MPSPVTEQSDPFQATDSRARRMGARAARMWNTRAGTWQHQVHAGEGFAAVRDALLDRAAPRPGDRCADLGAGTGFITLPLARQAGSVLAVDVSEAMLAALEEAVPDGARVETRIADLAELDLPPASLDLVVSSYALHHLCHEDKAALVGRVARWLSPGGRLVIADMMFGKGATRDDRAILAGKVRAMVRRGPGGWWRIIKNAGRFGLGIGSERPATPEFWQQTLHEAGFSDVRFERIVAESGLVSGRVAAGAADGAPAQD